MVDVYIFHTDRTGVISLWWFRFNAKLQHDIQRIAVGVYEIVLNFTFSCKQQVVFFQFDHVLSLCMHVSVAERLFFFINISNLCVVL